MFSKKIIVTESLIHHVLVSKNALDTVFLLPGEAVDLYQKSGAISYLRMMFVLNDEIIMVFKIF